jgi:AcrR family transcriptional regulator
MKNKKSQITSEFILKTVAPVFNKKGYFGTSMSDITTVTGLTKGAIYGNFKDKNELAVSAFVYNINLISAPFENAISGNKTSLEKLYALANFYNDYYEFTYNFGGCPILNVGVDANHQNEALTQKVKKAIHNLQNNLALIIDSGIQEGEINASVSAKKFARKFFAMIEGSVFMATTLQDKTYMTDLTESLIQLIDTELKNKKN